MNIDPRMLSELLKAQLLSGSMNMNESAKVGGSSNLNSVLEFAMLMKQLTETQGAIIENPEPQTKLEETSPVIQGQVEQFPARLMKASTFEPIVQRASREFDVPTSLIRAVMQAESGFNPMAVSPAGAKGLMQLMDGTAEGLGVSDSLDPEQNIYGGTRYLANLLKKYDGNISIAAAAYNAGPGRVDRLGIKDQETLDANYERLPEETQKYIVRVRDYQNNWVTHENIKTSE